MELPKITVVTPSYNQASYLEEAICSVLEQNYPRLEYIIIDGGSSDHSVSIIKKYEKYLAYWVSEPDKGQSHALNKGFRQATGSILAWLNADDFYAKNTLFYVAEQFNAKPIDVLCGACQMLIGTESKLLLPGKVSLASLLRYWELNFCPPQPSIFFSRRAFGLLGQFDEQLHYAMDYDLWLTIAKKYQFHCVEKVLSFYRVHPQSKTGTSNGFESFRPEWRKVAHKHLQTCSLLDKIRFYHARYRHIIPKQSAYYYKKVKQRFLPNTNP